MLGQIRHEIDQTLRDTPDIISFDAMLLLVGIRNERHPNKRKKLDTTVQQENVRRKLLVLNGLPPASFAYAAKSSYTYENKS